LQSTAETGKVNEHSVSAFLSRRHLSRGRSILTKAPTLCVAPGHGSFDTGHLLVAILTSRLKAGAMSFPITTASIGFTWVLTLAAAVGIAIWTSSLAGWAVVVMIALIPAVMMMVMANAPAKSMAEIIRDVEAGPSR
jgi:hypothetical protein